MVTRGLVLRPFGFTVRPLCHSGHSPARLANGFRRREESAIARLKGENSVGGGYGVGLTQCQPADRLPICARFTSLPAGRQRQRFAGLACAE
jgi:hypothetical protein